MRISEIAKLKIDPRSIVEYFGNYYEYIGKENNELILQNISSDDFIKVTEEKLLSRDYILVKRSVK